MLHQESCQVARGKLDTLAVAVRKLKFLPNQSNRPPRQYQDAASASKTRAQHANVTSERQLIQPPIPTLRSANVTYFVTIRRQPMRLVCQRVRFYGLFRSYVPTGNEEILGKAMLWQGRCGHICRHFHSSEVF